MLHRKLHDVESEKMKRKYMEIQRRQKEFHFLLQQDHTQPLVLGEPTMLAPLKNLTNQVSAGIDKNRCICCGNTGTRTQERVTRGS